ncbi:MAG: Uma2 family endonuclease [Isosphaeraceae bacterium]|nr:Uma2 family endonuclease [Isosphaeraceae bacterium]
MAAVDKPAAPEETGLRAHEVPPPCDSEGFPWLENGERMDQKTFHERYAKLPPGFRAELVEGMVHLMPSPLGLHHARNDAELSGCLFLYSAATPGTTSQNNATTILGVKSEPQPDSALLIRNDYGGQSRDGEGEANFTFGAPELLVEVALSSRSIDLNGKLRDYERAGVREYVVYDLRERSLLAFERRGARLEHALHDSDGVWRSRAFPGLWLDAAALASGDRAALVATLQRGLASPEHVDFIAALEQRRAALRENP